ncbi:MAG: hypothetical protein ACE5G2_12360 [Candidatus Krumholzibacteriia bacterium]
MSRTRLEGSPLIADREYDPQVAHTIWELERAVKRGRASEATRRALVKAHVDQLRMIEERAAVPEQERSFLFLQPRVVPGILMIPGEGEGCAGLHHLGERFHRRGFAVLASSLSYRVLGQPGRSPFYWQTCLDETEGRYDMLQHYASRIAVLGVGFGATMALHLATSRRVSSVLALFPTLHASLGLRERFEAVLRRLMPRQKTPPGWSMQRRMATENAREKADRLGTRILVIAEERHDRSEAGRSVRVAQRLLASRAAELRLVPPTQPDSRLELPPELLEELITFARPR